MELTTAILEQWRYECCRCKKDVCELDNLGQWECSIVQFNPLNGVKYNLPCDHGRIFGEHSELIISPTLAAQLPKIRNAAAVELYHPKGSTSKDRNAKILIHRHLKDPDIHSNQFIRLGP